MFSEIKPKSCSYGCGVEIYWNTEEKTYFELNSRKKHICPNRVAYNTNNNKKPSTIIPPTYAVKPKYYKNNDKKLDLYNNNNQHQITNKPKMDNSLELLSGSSISGIQKQYEILSDIVRDYNGKVHGSQRDRDPKTGLLDLLVYYEVPEGKREEVKQRYKNFIMKNRVY